MKPINEILGFLIFVAVSIVLSYWIGFLTLNPFIILIVSVIISYFFYQNFASNIKLEVPKTVWMLALLVIAMNVYPLLSITPIYPASSDSLHVVITRVLGSTIPETFAPYSELKLTYAIGFHLFANIFTEIFSTIPDYLIIWFFGILFAGLQLVFFYLFVKAISKNENIALLSAFLFVGTKTVFQNALFGLMPWILATLLFFVFMVLFLQKNKLSFLFFPVIFLVHPGSAFNMLLFLAFFVLFFREQLKQFLLHIPFLLFTLPAILNIYVILILSAFTESSSFMFSTMEFLKAFSPLFLWIGFVPSIALIIAILIVITKKQFSKMNFFLIFLLLISLFLFGYFAISQGLLFGKIVELISILAILLASIILINAKISFLEKFKPQIFGTILIISLFFFFSSGYLNSLRAGDKISQTEAEFAFAFKEFDSERETALILSKGNTKIAELSDKIPFNPTRQWFLHYGKQQSVIDESFKKLEKINTEWEKIVNGKCIECIDSLNVKYIVINKEFVDLELNKPIAFSFKKFEVYFAK